MNALIVSAPLAPLFGALVAGFGGARLGNRGAHLAAILSVAWAFVASVIIAADVIGGGAVYDFDWYAWARIGDVVLAAGFLVDNLTAMMMVVVTFVSLMVHVYAIGYMKGDPGYRRFFAYIALFTFAMLMLVMANNFLQLFFGWEAVGLVSYLLIGFWFKKPSAVRANLKAFLVNRIGDLGFLLGIALVLSAFGTLDYRQVFDAAGIGGVSLPQLPQGWDAAGVICLLLFVGAMGKSAQFPLHVWLPDSMEGPTPISALIHAATMVTAGIFMVARMSPLFEMSEIALTAVLVVGAATAFFTGLVGLVQNDIKRVVAYSTLSQLGYMTAALGASAYSAAVYHLFTHAFFKALLFLGAGSVIVAMHHEQSMTKMGGLRRKMPITYWTMLLGSFALMGLPPFAGFYSKDVIIEAVGESLLPGARVAYWALVAGAFVTALYSVRLLMLTFHGEGRMDEHARAHLRESPWTITLPLVLLAIPSVLVGVLTVGPMLTGGFFDGAIVVSEGRDTVAMALARIGGGDWLAMALHAIYSPVFYLALAGGVLGVWLYAGYPRRTALFARGFVYKILLAKYGFDDFNDWFFARGARRLGGLLWQKADAAVIDGMVNGAAKTIKVFAGLIRKVQTGAVYHYAFSMLCAVAIVLAWRLWL